MALFRKNDQIFIIEPHASGGTPVASDSIGFLQTTFYLNDMLSTTLARVKERSFEPVTLSAFGQPLNYEQMLPNQEAFYTGKPYDLLQQNYLLMFRNYDPELSRWTSFDPSGFPDGPNNLIYAPTPTIAIDPLGLQETKLGVPDCNSITLSNLRLTSVSLFQGNLVPEVGQLIDEWKATWVADVTMTFENPWPTPQSDVATKTATTAITINTDGNLGHPFVALSLVPLPFNIPVATNLAGAIGQWIADNILPAGDVNPIGIDPFYIQSAAQDVANSQPSPSDFGQQFPSDKYSEFYE